MSTQLVDPRQQSLLDQPASGDPFSPSSACRSANWTWGILPAPVRRMTDLSMGAKVMYSVLAEWDALNKAVFPGMNQLAKDVGVSLNQAARYIAELKSHDLIKVIPRERLPNGVHQSNTYKFLFHQVFNTKKAAETRSNLMVLPPVGVPPNVVMGYPQIWGPINTKEKYTPGGEKEDLKKQLQSTAATIHKNHPQPQRGIGVERVGKLLRKILQHKKLRGARAIEYLKALERRHEAWCQSTQWRKDGGQFAKGLENYLAPTMDRYEQDPPGSPCSERLVEKPGLRAGELE